MDERMTKKKLPEASDDFGSDAPDERSDAAQANAMAQVINLDAAKTRMRPPTSNDPPNVPIDEHIGRHLKAIYDDVLNQPIPDRFLDLLNQLDDESSGNEEA
jgi:hypothetical protein